MPGFGTVSREEKTNVPGTLADPPLKIETWSLWPKVIGDAEGMARMEGIDALLPCDRTVTVAVTLA